MSSFKRTGRLGGRSQDKGPNRNRPVQEQVLWVPVDALVQNPRNSRLHPREQIHKLAQTIKKLGVFVPILIDDDHVILAGHGRLQAARYLDMTEVTELGPTRLDRDLQKYIWNGKPHLSLKDLREYLNRYIYLPRLKNQEVLIKAVQASVSGMIPGPFAYAERWDEKSDTYLGLAIERAANAVVVIDSDSVIVNPAVAEAHRPAPVQPGSGGSAQGPGEKAPDTGSQSDGRTPQPAPAERKPTRFIGSVIISAERPARDMHQIVEAIVEQLTTLPGSSVKLRLEIDAEVPSGLDRAKVRTLVENANTLGFIDKSVE